MSDYDINKMDFKQLRNEVRLLRDELAIFKRKYEDIIYNLDDDNFSSRLVKQKGDMMTSITQTEESIKLQAEKVTENSQNISTLQITAEEIESTVFEKNDDGTKTSKIQQTADAIKSEASARVKADNQIEEYMSSIEQTAEAISTRVGSVENGTFGKYSLFTQKAGGFYFDGNVAKYTGVIFLTDKNFNNKASIYYGDGTDDMNQEYIAFWQSDFTMPMVLGYNPEKMYIGNIAEGNQIATREWVQKNGGGLAKFG